MKSLYHSGLLLGGLFFLGGCELLQEPPPLEPVVEEVVVPPPPPPPCLNPNLEGLMLRFSTPLVRQEAVTIAAVGDVLLHEPLQQFAATQPDGFQALIAPVADLIKGADIAFANLEGPAAANVYNTGREAKEPDSRYDGRVYTGYPMFNYHPTVASDLKTLGFDVVLTANNHAMDRHSLGVDRTIEALQAAGMPFTGTRHSATPLAPWHSITSASVGGKDHRIAWLGCTYGTNEIPDPKGQVLQCYEQQDEVLATIQALAADPTIGAVILVPHWGREYRHDPEKRQRSLALAALDAGATAVIGTHPHVLQPFETYLTPDRRETFIAYSLGNFISGQSSLARRSSVLLLLALMPDSTSGKLKMADVRFIPLHTVREGAGYLVEAIDRSGRGQKNRQHILEILPAGNLHPTTLPLWSGEACAAAASSS